MLFLPQKGFETIVSSIEEDKNKLVFINTPDFSESLYISPSYEIIFEKKRSELLEHPQSWIDSLIIEKNSNAMELYSNRIFAKDEKKENTIYLKIKQSNGKQLFCCDANFCLYDSFGRVNLVAGVFEVISEKKWLKAQKGCDVQSHVDNYLRKEPTAQTFSTIKFFCEQHKTYTSVHIPCKKKNGCYEIDTKFGKLSLSKRELENIQCLFTGMTAKQTAKHFNVSPKTVEVQISHVIKKIGCHHKSELFSLIPHTVY